jgi:formate dehydrogenase major subunit
LYDKNYVARFTEGLDAYREAVKDYAPENVEHLTGIAASDVRQAMRTFAAAPSATVMWGMGVTQFGQAVDVVKGLSSLALLTGNLGRPAVGVGPVRGQNNVQGACDMGVLPNMFPVIRMSPILRSGKNLPMPGTSMSTRWMTAWGHA